MRHLEYKGKIYPKIQDMGNASKYAIPFAKHYCTGVGVDIGFGKEDWKFPGAIGADITDASNDYHATNLPENLDYIYSSHCLEHLDDWVAAIELWCKSIKHSGVIFLYLPHPSQEYWLPWNNRKHKHVLHSNDVKNCLHSFGMKYVISSEYDLNNSYYIVAYNINKIDFI
jgi:predicted SAM-dependent methyltransferase